MKVRDEVWIGIGIVVWGWFIISHLLFAFKHPWATETERLVYMVEALTFQEIPYQTMRPND